MKKLGNFGNLAYKIYLYLYKLLGGGGRGGLRVEIGHHKIGSCVEIGQNRIRGGMGGQKNTKNVGHHLCTFPYANQTESLLCFNGPLHVL